jgi:hypothetical protein
VVSIWIFHAWALAGTPASVPQLLQQDGSDCHNSETKEGDLDLQSMSFQLSYPEILHVLEYAQDALLRPASRRLPACTTV